MGDFLPSDLRTILKRREQMEHKPGYKSTEFWIMLVVMLLTLLVHSGALPSGSPYEKMATEAIMMLGAAGYGLQRTWSKSQTSDDAAKVEAAKALAPDGTTRPQ